MDISSINSDLIRGNVTTIILGSLWNSDRYGYDILKEIESRSDGQYKLKQPTLYNQLKRLEKQGLISSYDGDPDDTGGGKRRYYTLTAEGRNFLQKEKREYEYSRTILDKLVSSQSYDFTAPAPFDTSELRPYAKKDGAETKPKIVYKDKIIEVEKIVEVEKPVEIEKIVEKKVYIGADGNEISEDEANRITEEARSEEERKQREKSMPAMTIAELFAKLDASSEYKKTEEADLKAENVADNSGKPLSFTTVPDLTPRDDSSAPENGNGFVESEIAACKAAPITETHKNEPFAISAVLGKRDEAFEYENNNVNYREFFNSISAQQPRPETEKQREKEQQRQDSSEIEADLKKRLYSEGYKIRPYSRGNTSEYYTFNFYHSNRIARDCYLIILAVFVLETAIMWLSLANSITYKYFLPILVCGAALISVPIFRYFINPSKRIRAKYNFKLSLLNRAMVFIELTVVCILISFFAAGITVNDMNGILMSIILPMALLTNLPISAVVYQLLYGSKRYHVA